MTTERRHPADAHARRRISRMLDHPAGVGRGGEPKTLGRVLRVAGAMAVFDLGRAARHYVVVRLIGAHLIPRPLRYLLYRLVGVRVQQARIAPGLFLGGPPSNLSIGYGTSINIHCFFDCLGRVTIGNDVMIGMAVTIVTSDHDLGPDGRPGPDPVARDVVIEDGAWLGARSTILPGVTVGKGAIVSAGAVITRDCRPYSIYAGVPARMVGQVPGSPARSGSDGTSDAAAPAKPSDTP